MSILENVTKLPVLSHTAAITEIIYRCFPLIEQEAVQSTNSFYGEYTEKHTFDPTRILLWCVGDDGRPSCFVREMDLPKGVVKDPYGKPLTFIYTVGHRDGTVSLFLRTKLSIRGRVLYIQDRFGAYTSITPKGMDCEKEIFVPYNFAKGNDRDERKIVEDVIHRAFLSLPDRFWALTDSSEITDMMEGKIVCPPQSVAVATCRRTNGREAGYVWVNVTHNPNALEKTQKVADMRIPASSLDEKSIPKPLEGSREWLAQAKNAMGEAEMKKDPVGVNQKDAAPESPPFFEEEVKKVGCEDLDSPCQTEEHLPMAQDTPIDTSDLGNKLVPGVYRFYWMNGGLSIASAFNSCRDVKTILYVCLVTENPEFVGMCPIDFFPWEKVKRIERVTMAFAPSEPI